MVDLQLMEERDSDIGARPEQVLFYLFYFLKFKSLLILFLIFLFLIYSYMPKLNGFYLQY